MMENSKIKDRIGNMTSGEPAKWLEKAKWHEENEEWLEKSARIAVKILHELRSKAITQKDLADSIGVTAQYINKVVKGGENLGLETICKIEKALGIILIAVPLFESSQILVGANVQHAFNFNRNNSQPVGSEKQTYQNAGNFESETEIFAEEDEIFV